MNVVVAATVGTLFGAGAYLVLKPDLFRVAVGIVLISNAANLTLMGAGLTRGSAPILPLPGPPSDPLVQAMTLTALVIGFAVTALLLVLVYRVYTTHRSVDLDELAQAEARAEHEREHEDDDEDEEAGS